MLQRLRFVKPLALAALLAGLVGCGTGVDAPQLRAGDSRAAQSPATTSPTMKAFQTETASSQTTPSSAIAPSTMASSSTTELASSRGVADVSEYRITPQDILQVSIFQ